MCSFQCAQLPPWHSPLASSVGAAPSPVAELLISAGVDGAARHSAHCAGAQDEEQNESSNFLLLWLFSLLWCDLLEHT